MAELNAAALIPNVAPLFKAIIFTILPQMYSFHIFAKLVLHVDATYQIL